MSSVLKEIFIHQTELLHWMYSQTRGHSGAPDFSLTPGRMKNTNHMEKTLSSDQKEIVTLFGRLSDEGIGLVMTQQIPTLESNFILKMETLLTQRTLALANTQKAHIDWMYNRLQQENMKLKMQVQDLTRELCRTESTRILPTWTPTTDATHSQMSQTPG